jgi:hypothetical protein
MSSAPSDSSSSTSSDGLESENDSGQESIRKQDTDTLLKDITTEVSKIKKQTRQLPPEALIEKRFTIKPY